MEQLKQHGNLLLLQRQAFRANALTSWVVFLVAHCLVIAAGWFAFKDFQPGKRARKATKTQAEQTRDEVEISADKVSFKITKPGLTLLLVAFAFYWLYIKFVYPVTVVQL